MSNELTEYRNQNLGIFSSQSNFQIALQASEMISKAPMIPDTYRGNPGACLIAINTANRLGIDFLMVMQNLYVVKGKPAWSGSFVRGLLNVYGKYEDISYEWQDPENRIGCRMVAIEKGSGKQVEGAWITPETIKKEGWGPKWNSMPEQMYMYRAAAFFARAHCPEAILGLQTIEEQEDVNLETKVGGKVKEPRIKKAVAKETKSEIHKLLDDAKIVNESSEDSMPAETVEKPLKNSNNPLDERIRKMVSAFETDFGITLERIESTLNHKAELCTETEVIQLGKKYKSLKDGTAAANALFPIVEEVHEKTEEKAAIDDFALESTESPIDEVQGWLEKRGFSLSELNYVIRKLRLNSTGELDERAAKLLLEDLDLVGEFIEKERQKGEQPS